MTARPLAYVFSLNFWYAANPQPAEVGGVPDFTEGPVFDYDGNLFFICSESRDETDTRRPGARGRHLRHQ